MRQLCHVGLIVDLSHLEVILVTLLLGLLLEAHLGILVLLWLDEVLLLLPLHVVVRVCSSLVVGVHLLKLVVHVKVLFGPRFVLFGFHLGLSRLVEM